MGYRASKPPTEGVCRAFVLVKPIGYQPLHACSVVRAQGYSQAANPSTPQRLALSYTHHCIALFLFVFHSWHAPDASMALALSAHTPRVQLSVYDGSASWRSELG